MARLKINHELPNATSATHIVDTLIQSAIAQRASDIHIESTETGLRVRNRIDGMLYDQPGVDQSLMQQVISRIKVLSHIDITEKRVPQDGKFKVCIAGNDIDLRVSTFPAIHGEKVVVRILDRAHQTIDLSALGMEQTMLKNFKDLIGKSSGFFIVSGPTGSGKTTTLYGALAQLNSPHANIITLEDPVEYSIAGITQGQINPDAGFTFEKGIRSVLRQDPDILMVGEIRDKQTARTAIEAALTGHLVLSTIHTHDAPGVIMRLMDMGIEPYLINAAVTGVLSQRLARKICASCRIEEKPNDHERALLERVGVQLDLVSRGAGCHACAHLGHRGRIGVFELLVMTSGLRSLIVQHPSFDAIGAQAHKDGMQPLLNDGITKVKSGLITVSELFRAVG